MEVEILSVQFIKPSCPTPNHLKTHKLSIIDQFMPDIFMPTVLFYSVDESPQTINGCGITQQRLKQLKESLSKVLTHFYPFAGRVKDKFTIDCNDEGVHYIEAKVSCTLAEYFNQSNFSLTTHKFLPNQPLLEISKEGYTAMAQVTCFACGGIAIGTLISHMIIDGPALSFFLNSWASSFRSEIHFQHEFEIPNFHTSFPRNDTCPQVINALTLGCQFLRKGKVTTKRFLFEAEAISRLKAQGSSLNVPNPTRVEVITSFLCKCAAKVLNEKSGVERPNLMSLTVHLRPRASPRFPNSCMGNFLWLVLTLSSGNELPDLVSNMRETVTAINSDFVKSLGTERGYVEHSKHISETISSAAALASGVNFFYCSSLCNLGFYNVDFGWGKPTWLSCSFGGSPDDSPYYNNSVVLMDTPSGNAIEAAVYLSEDEMAQLQQDKELLEFATVLYN